ncbi:MAG: chromosomal replication initiator protein DnaA [Planctomycetaceae bacterium]
MQTESSTMMLSMHTGQTDPTRTFWQELQVTLGERTFRHWFHGKTTLTANDDLVKLGVASPFLLTWMQKQFQSDVDLTARKIWGPHARVHFVLHGQPITGSRVAMEFEPVPAALRLEAAQVAAVTLPFASVTATAGGHVPTVEFEINRLSPANNEQAPIKANATSRALHESAAEKAHRSSRKTMDLSDFVVGSSNELAWTAVKQVVQTPGLRYHTLYLYGGVGIGKTHLLSGLARDIRREHPRLQVLHLTAENFANAFTQGLREKSLPGFRHRFRSIDVLLVDDVDFLDHKRVIQEEFLHTVKHLESLGKQIVLTSDRHPRLLTQLSEELVTRFLSGVVCRIEAPDPEVRLQIIRRKAERLNLELHPEVDTFIASRFQQNVRELEGALHSLQAVQSLTGKRITLATAKKVLAELERDCLRVVKLTDIEQAVCQFFGVPAEDLKSSRRSRRVSQPRMLAMFLARKLTTAAYSEIGQYFGGRNHSTVVSAEQRVQVWLDGQESCQISSQNWNWTDIIENLQQQLSA